MDLNKNNTIQTTNFKGESIEIPLNIFKQKVEAMLIGGAIGDALGVPVEMKTKEYIEKKYGRVNDYLDSDLNIFFNKGGLSTGKTGLISDDTILTFTGVESIIETGQIEFNNIMKKSIQNYKSFPYGFGGGTTRALSRYKNLEDNSSKENYINLGENKSAGNGVIMKQSPYSAYFLAKNTNKDSINTNIEILTKLTHRHPTAVIASLVHNEFLMELLKADKNTNLEELLNYLIKYSKKQEETFLEKDNDRISELIIKLLEDYKNGGLKSYDEILDKYGWGEDNIYSSGYVLITIGIVYSLFLNKQNFDSLLDSINIGGDVDTFGAIIGNMIGAYKAKFYTEKYENGIEKIGDLKLETNNFIENILLKNNKKDLTKQEYEKKLKKWNLEQKNINENFFNKINYLKTNNDIFYNSPGNGVAYKLGIKHLSIAQTFNYGNITQGYLIVKKEFYLADFESKIIKKINPGKKIKIIKIQELK